MSNAFYFSDLTVIKDKRSPHPCLIIANPIPVTFAAEPLGFSAAADPRAYTGD